MLTFAPAMPKSPDGGIGRRTGFKIQRGNTCAGSTPAPGTETEKVFKLSPFFCFCIFLGGG